MYCLIWRFTWNNYFEIRNKMCSNILFSFLVYLFVLSFREKVLLCGPGWPRTHNPSTSGSQLLALQVCAVTPSSQFITEEQPPLCGYLTVCFVGLSVRMHLCCFQLSPCKKKAAWYIYSQVAYQDFFIFKMFFSSNWRGECCLAVSLLYWRLFWAVFVVVDILFPLMLLCIVAPPWTLWMGFWKPMEKDVQLKIEDLRLCLKICPG